MSEVRHNSCLTSIAKLFKSQIVEIITYFYIPLIDKKIKIVVKTRFKSYRLLFQ